MKLPILNILAVLAVTGALIGPAKAQATTAPYFAGMFAQGCDNIGMCVDEARKLAQAVCGKLGYRNVATPTDAEEVLVIFGGGAQGNFTWQAPVNCTNRPF